MSVPSEKEIEEMYLKIQQNRSEDAVFSNELKAFLANDSELSGQLLVGKTPYALSIAGADEGLDVTISPRTIKKCMAEAHERYHGHGLDFEIMKQLPNQLRNPVMILKGSRENSLVAITNIKDKENREIMIAININSTDHRREVNQIASVYGRNNMRNYINAQIEQGNLVAANKEKAKELIQSLGLQLPPEGLIFSFDNSIAYSKENVKYPAKENFNKAVEIYGYDDEEEILDLTSVAGIGRR